MSSTVVHKKVSKWTVQQQVQLKKLKEQYGGAPTNWELISQHLNSKFKNSYRTPKQCREKFINYLRFGDNPGIYTEWTREEILKMKQMYEELGPVWSYMSSQLQNRSQNGIKNMFHNMIRKAAKLLYNAEKVKRSISYQILVAMIDFVNHLRKFLIQNNHKINNNSLLFEFRTKILKFILVDKNLPSQQIENLIRLIKNINLKLRTFGVFKSKFKQQWKFTHKCLEAVLQFDDVIEGYQVKLKQQIKEPINNAELEQRQNKINEKLIKRQQNGENLIKFQNYQQNMNIPHIVYYYLPYTYGQHQLNWNTEIERNAYLKYQQQHENKQKFQKQ